jgi:hypothetical protein
MMRLRLAGRTTTSVGVIAGGPHDWPVKTKREGDVEGSCSLAADHPCRRKNELRNAAAGRGSNRSQVSSPAPCCR